MNITGFSNGSIIVHFILTFFASEGKTVESIKLALNVGDNFRSDFNLLVDGIIIGVFINLRFLHLIRTCFY